MDTDSFFSECFKSKKNILNFTTKYFTHGCVSVLLLMKESHFFVKDDFLVEINIFEENLVFDLPRFCSEHT